MTRRGYHEGSMLCPHCGQPRTDHDGADVLCCARRLGRMALPRVRREQRGLRVPVRALPEVRRAAGAEPVRVDPGPDAAAIAAVRTAFEIELGGRAFYQRAAVEADR